ncbi:MAG: hypothetical protein WC302_02835 [Candidatus Paceibacterota bacterium]|jgi:succinylglutamate desuccinylase
MKIKEYKNLAEAIDGTIKRDKDYILLKHSLGKGTEIKTHFHKRANEFIVIDSGKLIIKLGKEEKLFNLKNKAVSILFPKQRVHSLLAISPITYFVIRDKKDISIYKK